MPLGVTASMTIENTLRTIDSKNVVAKIVGSDPKLRDEYVVYIAHWDHLGVGPAGQRRHASTTARRTTLSARPAFSRSRAPLPGSRRRPSGRSCSWRSQRRSRGCSGRSTTRCRPSTRWRRRRPSINMDAHQRQRPHEGPDARRVRRIGSRRLRARRGRRAGADHPARSGAGEGLLLPIGSLQLREDGRAGACTPTRAWSSSASREGFGERVRDRLHEPRLPCAVRRRHRRLGPERIARGPEAVLRGRLPGRGGRRSFPSGSPETSSGPYERRC